MSFEPTFSPLCAAIAADLKAAAPELRQCEVREQRLTIEEIAAARLATPSIFVVLLGSSSGREMGGPAWNHSLEFVAYVLTKNERGAPRDEACKALTEAAMRRVQGNRWGFDTVDEPTGIAMRNLSVAATSKNALAIRAVTWSQPIQLSRFTPGEGVVPGQLYAAAGGDASYDLVSGDGL